ncbi:adenosine receptor A2b-like [Montipora capricornis]|uniref:adenosine receptor A2b-like n=1 Tax=Montipora capricornis TaxID=246305 RepID=UPI0035F1AA54
MDEIGNMCESKDADPTWKIMYMSESAVIFILNFFTLIAFARNRHLRKRTMYLVINLTVADLLVGGVTIPLIAFVEPGQDRPILEHTVELSQSLFFPATLINLSLIALDRLHATLFPFRHCLIGGSFYCKVIAGNWLVALLIACTIQIVHFLFQIIPVCAYVCIILITAIIIIVCYVSIAVNVNKGKTHHHNLGAISSETKLSLTLFIMTAASVLTILPITIWWAFECGNNCLEKLVGRNVLEALTALYFVNSVVNPLIYALRMRAFRKIMKALFCKTSGQNLVAPH